MSLRALRRASRGHGYVIHLAARPFVPESFVRAGPVRHVNVDGTANVLQAVKELVAYKSKAMELLGWTPKWDFEQALEQTIKWYRTNGRMWAYKATSRQRKAGQALPR